MAEKEQYHSSLHESDNKYHTVPGCPLATTIIERCRCEKYRPNDICDWCRGQRA